MKKTIPLIALAALCLGFTFGHTFRWTWNDKPIIEFKVNGLPTLQFGLRSDGVVVWREITTSTNSPQEVPIIWSFEAGATNSTGICITNLTVTNLFIQ